MAITLLKPQTKDKTYSHPYTIPKSYIVSINKKTRDG
jgi:hypothetical protein